MQTSLKTFQDSDFTPIPAVKKTRLRSTDQNNSKKDRREPETLLSTLAQLRQRNRWDGVLSKQERLLCQQHGISLAYDCSQQGWIVYDENEEFGNGIHDQETVLSNRKNSLSNDELTTLLEEFHNELAQANGPLNNYQLGFEAINKVLRKSQVDGNLQLLNALHCTLLCNMVKQSEFRLPHNSGLSAHYRNWEQSDVPLYLKIMGNEKVWQHLPEAYPQPFTEELAKNFIEIANINSDSTTQAIIFEGKPIGQIRLLKDKIHKDLKASEIVYMLDENYWGKGLMSNFLLDFVRQEFATDSLDFIYAWIKPENASSIRCAERAGFIKDYFVQQNELAKACGREGFVRYICANNT